MNQVYILIIVSFFSQEGSYKKNIPYYEIISTHETYDSCDKEIIKTHDYYLAKDIRRKKTKQRSPKFVYDDGNNKLLTYKYKNTYYYASCKLIEISE